PSGSRPRSARSGKSSCAPCTSWKSSSPDTPSRRRRRWRRSCRAAPETSGSLTGAPGDLIVTTMESVDAARRGRPRSFDREQALRAALRVFREHGYEGTSMSHLQEALGGLSPPSIYAAFGSKEQLFKEATDLYVAARRAAAEPEMARATTTRD